MFGLRSLLLWLALTVLAAASGSAELVVLNGGRVLKVSAYEVGPKWARLSLASGGALVVRTRTLERIVEDEVVVGDALHLEEPSGVALTFAKGASAPATPHAELIYDASRRHGVNPAVVAAMVRVESSFDPRAVSAKGARGLMQLMPATALRFGVEPEALFDPRQNLEAGTRYLRWLVDRFHGDALRVFAAYNAGEGAVERYGGVPPFRETHRYVEKLLSVLGVAGATATGG
jgi:hypothetical protein